MTTTTVYRSENGNVYGTEREALLADFQFFRQHLSAKVDTLTVFLNTRQFQQTKDLFNVMFEKYKEYRQHVEAESSETLPTYERKSDEGYGEFVDLAKVKELRVA